MRKYLIPLLLAVFLIACNGNIENQITEELPQSQELQAAEELLQPQYPQILTTTAEQINFVIFSEGIFCIYNDVNYGFMNEDGEEITSYIYDFAYPFSEGLACVYQDGKYGFIDKYGNEALPFIYDKANSFMEGLAYFEIGDKYGFIDQNGNEVFLLDCDSISSFQEGLAYFSINGKYGYIDKMGKEVIEPLYDDADYFQDGLAMIRIGSNFGIIDKMGNEIVPAKYDKVGINNNCIWVKLNDKYGYYNNNGKIILPCEYDNILRQDNNIIYSNGKSGLADINGNIMIEPIYDNLRILKERESDTELKDTNLIEFKMDGRYGIMDFDGNIEVPAKYESIVYFSDGMLAVSINKKTGFINTSDFSESIPLIYDFVWPFKEGRTIAVLKEKYGVIDKNGDTLFPFDYDGISIFKNGSLLLNKDGKNSLINSNGNMISELRYDRIFEVNNYYRVEMNGKSGFLNESGEEIIPPIYNHLFSGVYRSNNYYVTSDYFSDRPESIIKKGDDNDIQVDLSNLILKNEITPKIKLYNQFLKQGYYTNSSHGDGSEYTHLISDAGEHVKTVKLYDIDGSGNPILYYYDEPVIKSIFPLSHSGFYSIKNNKVNQLFSGYEFGGSLRGDYVCLWKDQQTSKITIGLYGSNNYTSYHYIYDYSNGEVKESISFRRIGETAEDLEIWINGKQSTVEEYHKLCERFEMILNE